MRKDIHKHTHTSIMQNRTIGVKINGWTKSSFGKLNKKQARRAGKALVASRNLNGVLNHKQNVGRKLQQKWKDSPAICKCSWPAFSLPVGKPAQLENKPVLEVSPERFIKTRFKDHCTSGLELHPLSSGKVNRTVFPGQLFT